MRRILRSALVGAALVAAFVAGDSRAATMTLGLDIEFSGGVAPGGTTPWITATFDDSFGGPDTVRLTMTATNLLGGTQGENIAEWLFNFDSSLDPTLLTFTAVSNSAAVPNAINKGANAYMADGDGNFDIQFVFPPPPGSGAARFTGGETVIYDITYGGGPISASSFAFFSSMGGGQGSFLSAAQIQRTPNGGNGSGWIGVVPEPSTGLLFGAGLLVLTRCRRARR